VSLLLDKMREPASRHTLC